MVTDLRTVELNASADADEEDVAVGAEVSAATGAATPAAAPKMATNPVVATTVLAAPMRVAFFVIVLDPS